MIEKVLKPTFFTANSAATEFWLIMVPLTRLTSTCLWP